MSFDDGALRDFAIVVFISKKNTRIDSLTTTQVNWLQMAFVLLTLTGRAKVILPHPRWAGCLTAVS